MLNYVCYSVLLLVNVILAQDPIQEYVIQRDIFNVLKAAEFSVYDTSEAIVYYRIESNYGLTQNVKVVAQPSKQEIGGLQAKLNFLFYNADISIIDSQTNQWINGEIEQKFKLFLASFNITWNGHHIKLENDGIFSLTSKFYDEDQQLLAQVRRRLTSVFRSTYDMKIFSNKYPVQVYFLGFAALRQVTSPKSRG